METIKLPITFEWVNKIWYIHAMEYYLPTKMDKIPTHATIWVDLANMKPSKRHQKQTATNCIIPFI